MHINIILSLSLLSTSAIGLVIPADDILESRSPAGRGQQGPPPVTKEQVDKGHERYMQMTNLPDPNHVYHVRGGPTAPPLTYTGKDIHALAQKTAVDLEKSKTQQVKSGVTPFKNLQHGIPLDHGIGGKRTFDGLKYNPQNLVKETKLPFKDPAKRLDSKGEPATSPARAMFRKSSVSGDYDYVGFASHHQGKPPGLDNNDHFSAPGYAPAHRDTYQHHPGPHGYADPLPAVDPKTGKQNYNRLPPLHTNGYDPSNPFKGPDMVSSPKAPDPLPRRKISSAERYPKPLSPEDNRGEGSSRSPSSSKYQGGSSYQGGSQYQVSKSQLGQGSTRQDSTGQGSSSRKGKERSSKERSNERRK